jgi:threonine dehydrogenase-like Zn-dependent dehydrogenase
MRDLATHHLPLNDAPPAYAMFQRKQDDAIKVVFEPQRAAQDR